MVPLIATNWKMNGSYGEINQWLDEFIACISKHQEEDELQLQAEVVVCPPDIFLEYFINEIKSRKLSLRFNKLKIGFGGQNCHYKTKGAYTTSVSAGMLKEVGCDYVIVGHSERRMLCYEDETLISKKVSRALDEGLMPIICVGETSEERKTGHHFQAIGESLINSLPVDIGFREVVIAYEPVWAINDDAIPTIKEITEVISYIKNIIIKQDGIENDTRVIYGGSVDLDNSGSIMSIEGLNGLLVGRAGLHGEDSLML